jgi:hypothetical protein
MTVVEVLDLLLEQKTQGNGDAECNIEVDGEIFSIIDSFFDPALGFVLRSYYSKC